MSDQPVKLMIAVYESESAAKAAFDGLKESAKAKHVGLQNAALVDHTVEGKLQIKEVHEFNAGKGAGWGLVLGGVAGLLTGGAALLVLGTAGAAVGAVAGKIVDKGIPKDQLEYLGQALTPGTSALMVIADQGSAEAVEQELTAAGGIIKTTELQAQIAKQVQSAQFVEGTLDAEQPGQAEKISNMARNITTTTGGTPY